MAYTELHCISNYSFLRGASHPEELVHQAANLGYKAIGKPVFDDTNFARRFLTMMRKRVMQNHGKLPEHDGDGGDGHQSVRKHVTDRNHGLILRQPGLAVNKPF